MKTKITYNRDGSKTVIVNGKELHGKALKKWEREQEQLARENLAAMVETGKFPGSVTNDSFLGTRGTLAKQFEGDPDVFRQVVGNAKAAGYTPSSNDVYLSQLADFPGDPKAFVSRSRGGRQRVAEILDQKGVPDLSGSVKAKGRQDAPPPAVKLGTDLVESNVEKMVKKNPDLKRVDRRDLRAEAVKKHGAQT